MTRVRWWALAVASVVAVLILVSAQQTGALWRSQSTVAGARINSGSLTILAGGQSVYPWTDFGGTNLASGAVVQKALAIAVAGSPRVKVGYQLQSVAAATQDVPLTFTAWIVANTASCPASGNPTNVVSGPLTTFPAPAAVRIVTVGSSEVWCIRATVGASATANKSTTATLTFRAVQQA